MYLTVHTTIGALIGEQTNNIIIAFILGLFSHFLLDAIPHKDPEVLREVKDLKDIQNSHIKKLFVITTIDVLILLSLISFLFSQRIFSNPDLVLAGIVGSLTPDFLLSCCYISRGRFFKKFAFFHNNLVHFNYKKIRLSQISGLGIQVIIILSVLIFYFSNKL